MGRYGGTTTVMNTLPVGTSFYVCNGAWDGMITEKDGVKHIKIGNDREFPISDDYKLDIEIKKKKYQIVYDRTEVRVMIVEADSEEEAEQKYNDFDCIKDYEDYGLNEDIRSIKQIG